MTPTTTGTAGAARPLVLQPAGGNRNVREIVRDEQVMRRRILAALGDGPLTVPEIAAAVDRPSHEVMFWVMGLRKYGWVAEIKEVTDEGYYRYQVVEREGS
jgi:predicted Rossmann fold nucleotide-binding protein DprA/Smf involved in DNA uptake